MKTALILCAALAVNVQSVAAATPEQTQFCENTALVIGRAAMAAASGVAFKDYAALLDARGEVSNDPEEIQRFVGLLMFGFGAVYLGRDPMDIAREFYRGCMSDDA